MLGFPWLDGKDPDAVKEFNDEGGTVIKADRRRILWMGNANMTFNLRPTNDRTFRGPRRYFVAGFSLSLMRLWHSTYGPTEALLLCRVMRIWHIRLRPTEDVLPWPGNANMAFDLRSTEDVLLWPGNANMAFDLRPTEDVLPWPGNVNMAFNLRPTKVVLP
ncbi:hypothetical protein Tco_0907939 [Tanacetum coccineum]|uniref:Uncharacterized protein n=1 Tax=Tanacetum coccineum TaxID=301880 RepID=A0ABQ5CLU4_9ASTR